MYNYGSSQISILIKIVILSACLSGAIISMENATFDKVPLQNITVEFSTKEKTIASLSILQKFKTLDHFLEDYNFSTHILVPEFVTKKNFDVLVALASWSEKSVTSYHDVRTSLSHDKYEKKINRILKSYDTQRLADLLNLADFLAIPCLFDRLIVPFAKKIMHTKEFELFWKKEDNYLTFPNPDLWPLVIHEILKQNDYIRVSILRAYPIPNVMMQYQYKGGLLSYICHNKTVTLFEELSKTLKVYAISSGTLLHAIPCIYDIKKLIYSPDGTMIAVTVYDTHTHCFTTTLFEVSTGQKLLTVQNDVHEVTQLLLSPDNATLAIQDEKNIYLWDIPNKKYRESIEYNFSNNSIRYTANNTLVTITTNRRVLEIQDIKTRSIIHKWSISTLNDRGDIKDIIISDTDIKIFYKDNSLKIYNFYGTSLNRFTGTSCIENVYHNPDSFVMISRSKGNFYLSDISTAELVRNFEILSKDLPKERSLSPDHNTYINFSKNKFNIYNLKPIHNLSQTIGVPQIMLFSALARKVITLTSIEQNTYWRAIKDSLPFDSTSLAPWSLNNSFSKIKSLFS